MERKGKNSARPLAKRRQLHLAWQQELVALGISDGLVTAILNRLLAAPLTSLDILTPVPVRGAADKEMRIYPFRLSGGRPLPKNRRIHRTVKYQNSRTLEVHILSNHVNQMLRLLRFVRKPKSAKSGPIYISIGAVIYYFTAIDNDLLAAARNLTPASASKRSRQSLLNSKIRARILTLALNFVFHKKYAAQFPFSAKWIADHIQKDSRRPKHLRLSQTLELTHGQREFLEELDGVNDKSEVERRLHSSVTGLAVDEAIELSSARRGALAMDWVRTGPGTDLTFYEELRDRIEDPFWGHPLSKLFPPPC